MRVLVVEDDPALGSVLTRGLREEGHAVDLEGTVAGAEFALDITEYDLLLLDLGLPDGDGLAVCHRLREQQAQTRVLVLTARDTLSDRVGGLDTGADDYLTKPFDFPELAARVRALLRRPATDRKPFLEVEDLRLDPAAQRVWRGAVLIPLTPREFALLHYLMARPGEVVSRTDILEHVWDAHYSGLSNVVDVHMASLRRKLDMPGIPAPIDTIRGIGYRLGT
jgi:two-component system OmpR family response regulator